MIRKLLMITTAIVALGAAPVFAQGSTYGTSPAPGKTLTAPASGKAVAGQATTTEQTMPAKRTVKSAAKSPSKMTHKANASAKHGKSAYREMNAREVATTRTLNRDAASGGRPQSAAAPVPMMDGMLDNMPTQGAGLPANIPSNDTGVGGSPND